MCYLCLAEQFQLTAPKSKLQKSKDRAAEIKLLLQKAEENLICDDGDKVISFLKEEQYNLSRYM